MRVGCERAAFCGAFLRDSDTGVVTPDWGTGTLTPDGYIRVACGCSGVLGKLRFDTIKEGIIEFTIGVMNKLKVAIEYTNNNE